MTHLATALRIGAAAALSFTALSLPAQALDTHGLVVACVKSTGVQGEYDFAPNAWPPLVRPLEGGTTGGAARINACIEQTYDPYAPAYAMRITAETDPALRGWMMIAAANERNQESARCQTMMTGGTAYTCHRPW
ncbi:hypothetical protein [Gemmobacter serpentinus]|uniref:hypothetical protein n=1 Tax=Gemmobacter serpentinus TaxID=2652247 RepID=UPI00124DB2C7|nr:hypothetical protein [Gemmobacter serpentinus]